MAIVYKNGLLVDDSSFQGHSITFGSLSGGKIVGKNTWDDWHLIPSSRPKVSLPGVQLNIVDIPGRDGGLDFSDYLTGQPVLSDRSGSWEFLVDNDHEDWMTIKTAIMDYLHGKRLQCALEDDPSYYYEGRFNLNEWRSESWNSVVIIDYVVGPSKKHV